MNRTPFIDNIRIFLTALVIFHHTAMIYGAMGGWCFREVQNAGRLSPTSVALSAFCGINQAYFMGLFFLLAGYFTPPAYDKKGPWRFVTDRLLRLGVPLLAYVVFLGPMTNAMVARVTVGYSFRQSVLAQWRLGAFAVGPMWFVEALLLFTAAYVFYRLCVTGKEKTSTRSPDADVPLNNHKMILLSLLGVSALAFVFLHFFPLGTSTFGMILGYFGPYVFLFPLGCLAWRGRWLEKVDIRRVWPWAVVSLVGGILMVTGLRAQNKAGLLHEKKDSQHSRSGRMTAHSGLLTLKSDLFLSLFLTLIAWGIMLAILSLFRLYANRPSRLTAYLSERMYTVYIVHAPVLTAAALCFRFWAAPHALKFLVTGSVACLVSILVADAILRIPGSRRIL